MSYIEERSFEYDSNGNFVKAVFENITTGIKKVFAINQENVTRTSSDGEVVSFPYNFNDNTFNHNRLYEKREYKNSEVECWWEYNDMGLCVKETEKYTPIR